MNIFKNPFIKRALMLSDLNDLESCEEKLMKFRKIYVEIRAELLYHIEM